MIFLNAERFIEGAIRSVFAQSYDRWELLLVDDGSSDSSSELALRYSELHPQKVRYLQHPGHQNLGISASQNLGIREARGEYVAFLDSDDVWMAEKLEEQVEILDSHPEAAMVYGATQYWYSWAGQTADSQPDLLIEPGIQPCTLVRPPELLVRFLRQEIPIPCPSDIMVRRGVVIATGGFEQDFRRIYTDQAFYSKLCLKWPVFVTGQRWFKYRKHADSAVAVVKKMGQLRQARLTYLNWLERYMDEQGVKDREVRRALDSARWKCLHPALFRLSRHVKYVTLITEEMLKRAARQTLPSSVYRRLRAQRQGRVGEPR